MRRIPWAFLLFLPACGTHAVDLRHQAPATLAREPFGYEGATVDRVVDGDTVVVRITGRVEGPGAGAAEVGEEYRVRLIGIDTPESVDPRRPVECFGQEAAAATGALLEEQPVMLIKDVEEQDSFGRLLRYVYIGQEMANARLVVNGYANAYTYPPNVRHTDLFVQLQREARISERGLWSPTTCQASTRWDGEVRRSSHPYGGETSKPTDLQLERPGNPTPRSPPT